MGDTLVNASYVNRDPVSPRDGGPEGAGVMSCMMRASHGRLMTNVNWTGRVTAICFGYDIAVVSARTRRSFFRGTEM